MSKGFTMRFSRVVGGIVTANFLTLLALASCSSDNKKHAGSGGSAGDSANAGNGGETGGAENRGGGGSGGESTPAGGDGGAGDVGGTGGTTSTTVTSALDNLINAVCSWEFKCCDAGEARYELGPTIGDVTTCKAKFVYELHVGNSEKGPFPASTIYPLLNDLGYSVNLANVTENTKGIAQCLALWKVKACNATAATASPAHCTATTYGTADACALENLVKPKLVAGDTCNVALAENGTRNDIECVAGTTCIAANTDDNGSSLPKCITRGQADVICTSNKNCDNNFYCNFTTGKCTEKGDPGDACAYKNATAPTAGALSEPCKPGLTCNPITKTCLEDCKTNSVCTNGGDFLCPSGESCLPTTVGSNTDGFKLCGAAGNSVARCDSPEDCGAGYYCKGTTCATVGAADAPCNGTPGECAADLYCKGTVCTAYTAVGSSCTPKATGSTESAECNPAVATAGCVYNYASVATTSHACSTALLANGELCGGNWDCASERCEVAPTDSVFRCTAGAALNVACDDVPSTATALSCAEGLTCLSGACVAQVGPGSACNLEAEPADGLCTNGDCNSTVWQDAEQVMCSAAPVPKKAGGTNVTCDGA